MSCDQRHVPRFQYSPAIINPASGYYRLLAGFPGIWAQMGLYSFEKSGLGSVPRSIHQTVPLPLAVEPFVIEEVVGQKQGAAVSEQE
jgi:hypothetical protein